MLLYHVCLLFFDSSTVLRRGIYKRIVLTVKSQVKNGESSRSIDVRYQSRQAVAAVC